MLAASYSGMFSFVISAEWFVRFKNNNWNIKDEYLLVNEQYLYYLLCLGMYIAQYYSEMTVEGSKVTSMF
jgi:hypothetical protein